MQIRIARYGCTPLQMRERAGRTRRLRRTWSACCLGRFAEVREGWGRRSPGCGCAPGSAARPGQAFSANRSEEHTSELQSRGHLVCRLLLEKKKNRLANRPQDRTRHVR